MSSFLNNETIFITRSIGMLGTTYLNTLLKRGDLFANAVPWSMSLNQNERTHLIFQALRHDFATRSH